MINFKQSEKRKENNNTINYNIRVTYSFWSILLFKSLPPGLLRDAISRRPFNIFLSYAFVMVQSMSLKIDALYLPLAELRLFHKTAVHLHIIFPTSQHPVEVIFNSSVTANKLI